CHGPTVIPGRIDVFGTVHRHARAAGAAAGGLHLPQDRARRADLGHERGRRGVVMTSYVHTTRRAGGNGWMTRSVIVLAAGIGELHVPLASAGPTVELDEVNVSARNERCPIPAATRVSDVDVRPLHGDVRIVGAGRRGRSGVIGAT